MNNNLNFFQSHGTTALGLWLTAGGILVQAATGAKGYPRIPPGIIILAVAGALVFMTRRYRWASIIGILLAALVSIGVFTTHGTAERLSQPADVGPFAGTLIQLAGLLIALVAGVTSTTHSYRGRSVQP